MRCGGVFAHPAFDPWTDLLANGTLPDFATLAALARARGLSGTDGRPLAFAQGSGADALTYENAIAREGLIRLRQGDVHDVFNALAWLAFPRAKVALNAVHVRDQASATGNARSRARDAATLVDESGLLLGCAEPDLVALLRRRGWREVFVERRVEATQALRPLAIGHGLLQKLQTPYRALTAHALVVPVDRAALASGDGACGSIDAAAAQQIVAPGFAPERLLAVPVAAFSGWDAEGLGERLFDDVSVFRLPRATLSGR